MRFTEVQDAVDMTVVEAYDMPPVEDWVSPSSFCPDWLSGVLPLTDVRKVFTALEKYSGGQIKMEHFAVSTGGLFNYSCRLCFLGKFYLQIAYNPASVAAEKVWTPGKTAVGGVPSAELKSMKGAADLTARERKDAAAEEKKAVDDWEHFRGLRGDMQTVPLVATDAGNNPGVYLSITGQGCATLSQLGAWGNFVKWLYRHDFRCSRVDFALDLFQADNPLVPLLLDGFVNAAGAYVQGSATMLTQMVLSKNLKLYRNFYPDAARESWSLSFGKHNSNSGMLRVYDKFYEVLCKSADGFARLKAQGISYWYRVEYECHNDLAKEMFRLYAETGSAALCWIKSTGACFSPRYAVATVEQKRKNPIHPVWFALYNYCISQNDYFVQFGLLKQRSALAYQKWLQSMSKAFFAMLRQLMIQDDADVVEYVNKGLEKYGGDPFLTGIYGDADPETASAFVDFLLQYRQTHAQKHINCALSEVV